MRLRKLSVDSRCRYGLMAEAARVHEFYIGNGKGDRGALSLQPGINIGSLRASRGTGFA
jgi:hypothetical protein